MELHELKAHLSAVCNMIPTSDTDLPFSEAKEIFNRYSSLRGILLTKYPESFKMLPKQALSSEYSNDKPVPFSAINPILRDAKYCLDVLRHLNDPIKAPELSITREGIFFSGQHYDALRFISEIFSTAKKSIVIIDAYIDENVLDLLSDLNIEKRILTKSITGKLRTSAGAFNKQYGQLSIRCSDAFHDRFVIIDEADYYHLGASIKDLGRQAFMFSRIEEAMVIKTLKEMWEKEWSNAKIEI